MQLTFSMRCSKEKRRAAEAESNGLGKQCRSEVITEEES